MVRFIKEQDYDTIIRDEIRVLISGQYSDNRILLAESMAIRQVKHHLKGRYDIEAIFDGHNDIPFGTNNPDTRDAFIIMIVIDCAIYHLYSNTAPDRIPIHRKERYQDALDWLKSIMKGEMTADLPMIEQENPSAIGGVIIKSKYAPSNNRY